MQFSSIHILAILAAGTVAMPNNLGTGALLDARATCKSIHPACNGGHVAGPTNYRCSGQVEPCDLWSCPGENSASVCGQKGSGCVFI